MKEYAGLLLALVAAAVLFVIHFYSQNECAGLLLGVVVLLIIQAVRYPHN